MGGFADLIDPDLDALLDTDDEALCRSEPDSFFPEKGGSTRKAKAVCRGCPLAVPCLEYAIDHGERFGVWGGLSERERRRMRRAA